MAVSTLKKSPTGRPALINDIEKGVEKKMKKYVFPNNKKFFLDYNHNDYPELHCHTYYEITIITEGSFVHLINDQPHTVTENTFLFIRPKDRHALKGSGSYMTFGFTEKYFLGLANEIFTENDMAEMEKYPFIEFPIPHPTTISFIANVQSLFLYSKDSDNYQKKMTMLFLDFFKEFVHQFYAIEEKRERHLQYSPEVSTLIKKIHDKDSFLLSVDEIIRNVNYSHSHILRLFKKETGMTILKYLQKIKINYAKNLLETTNMSVSQIAYEVGIFNIGHFSLIFKKEFGLSPLQYRKQWTNYYQSFEEV